MNADPSRKETIVSTENKGNPEPRQVLTPQDVVRKRVRERLVPKIAELIYQADKGNEYAKLSDIFTESSRAVYIDQALVIVFGRPQALRMMAVNVENAHAQALQEDEERTLARQAQRDVRQYGGRS